MLHKTEIVAFRGKVKYSLPVLLCTLELAASHACCLFKTELPVFGVVFTGVGFHSIINAVPALLCLSYTYTMPLYVWRLNNKL